MSSSTGGLQRRPSRRPAEQQAFSRRALLDTYLPALLLALGTGIALPAIPTLAKSFNVSFGLASAVITAFLFGNAAGLLPTGWLVDRFGRRRIMLIGPLLTSVMAVAAVFAHTFPELLVYRFIGGWASQMWLVGRLTGISAGSRANQRGRLVSWMFEMDNVGRLSGPLVGGFVAAAWGLRAPFAAYAVLALLALIPGYLLLKDTDRPDALLSGREAPARKVSLRELRMPAMAFFGVAFFAAMALGSSQSGMLQLYAAFQYDLNPRSLGFLATTASILSLPIGLLAPWAMDRFGRKSTMVPGFSGATVAMLVIAITALLHSSLLWYSLAFLFSAATSALTSGSVMAVGTDIAPFGARGTFLGLWRFTGQVPAAISPIVFGYLASTAGYPLAFVFLTAAALIVVLLLVRFVPETAKPVESR